MDERLKKSVSKAVKHFWTTRDAQHLKQGTKTGLKDTGARGAVTGGKHLDGFVSLCRDLLVTAGVSDAEIFWRQKKELPGYFRAEKNWDLVVVTEGQLLAVMEFKAQVGPSFGNNFNNRTEEALGNATDLWSAYREGAFKPSPRPWLGYVFIVEDCLASRAQVRVKEPHFPAFAEFRGASYIQRYEVLLTKLLRERLYDGVSLILTPRVGGEKGRFTCPSEELAFETFAAGLTAHTLAHSKKF
jgi:hypothetical protein